MPTQVPKLISKTKIMQGYQCLKNIYLSVHQKSLIPPVTPELQALFDQGNAVTVEARKRFPQGVLVENAAFDFVGSLQKTRELLAQHTPVIFEAAFEYKGCYARADVIEYNPLTQRWSVIEVKSATRVKDEHLDDVGLQVWIMANAGLPIEKISVMHLNNLCKFPDLSNLFIQEDVTDKLRSLHTSISPKLNNIFQALRSEQVPAVEVGKHCSEPRDCQFMDHCWGSQTWAKPNLFDLPGMYTKRWELFEKGFVDLQTIPEESLSEKEKQCLQVLKTGQRHVDKNYIKEEMAKWKFPLVFLDFETLNPAIPVFEGTGPFTQVPFQFSVHVLENLDATPVHFEFLADAAVDGCEDPRKKLVPALVEACKGEGSVVAYYAKFESGCLQDLEIFAPEYASELAQIRSRLVDPLPIIKEAIYDAKFGSSYSLKSVGPALLGDVFSYDRMAVGDGGAAQRAYDEYRRPGTSEPRKNELKTALLEYCKKDTFVVVELVKWLYQFVK
jgi:hypothetical protein